MKFHVSVAECLELAHVVLQQLQQQQHWMQLSHVTDM
jgi:hypothetical protein